jgi:hypothetical protein
LDLHTGSVVDQQQSLITPVKVSSDGSSAHSVVPLPADVHDGLLLYSTDSTVGYINMQSQQQQDNNGEVRAMVSGVWTHTTFGLPIESIFPLNSSSSRIQKTEEESSKGQKWNGNGLFYIER